MTKTEIIRELLILTGFPRVYYWTTTVVGVQVIDVCLFYTLPDPLLFAAMMITGAGWGVLIAKYADTFTKRPD